MPLVSFFNKGRVLLVACIICGSGCAVHHRFDAQQPTNKAPANVNLSGLDHVYDRAPKGVVISTDPPGLDVKITYDGKDGAPVNAGSYTVAAVVRDTGFEGSAMGILTIAKTPQKITFDALATKTYDDKPFALDATVSSGLKPVFESSDPGVAAISGSRVKITGAGTALITASQAGDWNHLAADPVQQTLTVSRAHAKIELRGLDRTFDGKPKPAEAKTDPRDLAVKITYDGKDNAPVDAGSYTVAATIKDANYEGSATAIMTIAKAPQKITFKALQARTFGDADFPAGTLTSSALPISYTSSDASVAAIVDSQVHIVGAGTAVITAMQNGDANYLAAEPMQRAITVKKAPVAVTLGNLEQTYDGKPKPAASTTTPAGLTVTITYDGSGTIPVNAGKYMVAGTIQDANYEGSAKAKMTIAKAPQSITFDAPAARTYGDAEFSPGAITNADLALSYKSSDPRVATMSPEGTIRIVGAGTATIAAAQAGDGNHLPAETVQRTLTVNKAPAGVILGSLEQTYDGKPKPITSATTPGGLFVKITYDGKDKPPVDAGSYTVAATVQDANYEGSATATMTVAKATQTTTFNALATRTYGDRPFSLTAALSSGLSAVYESSNSRVAEIVGSEVKIVGAGTTVITAMQAGNRNYLAAEPVQQTLTVNKALAKVSLGNLKQTYDGKPKPAISTMTPGGLAVIFTYEGSDQAPVNAGSYQVVGTVQEANYEGSATAAMTVEKAPQRITFDPLPVMTYSETPFTVTAAVSSGLTATYDSSNASVAAVSGDQVTIRGVGTATITSYQAGNENYLPAPPVQQVLVVKKALAKINLSGLEHTYDGTPKQAGITTGPEGLKVSITYEGIASPPVNAGSYKIAAKVEEANYEGSATASMTIAKAPQKITFNALIARTYGDETPYLLFATVSSGLTASYLSSDPAVAIVYGNRVTTRGAGTTTITAVQAGDRNHLPADPVPQVLTVKKTSAWVALSGLDAAYTYDGRPKRALVTTSPEGLNVSITYNGSPAAPADAGRYRVSAIVQDANYKGSATGTLTITQAPQNLKFPRIAARTYGDKTFDLLVSASSGLTPVYESSDSTIATVSGSQVTITGAGATTIIAYQPGNRNYHAAEPVKRVLVVRGAKPRIVVYPVDNLSGKPAPLKEIRQLLVEGLIKHGVSVIEEDELNRFMARHRVRYIGGVDTVTARAWKEEAGMEAVLITSVDEYDETDTPKIAFTSRLVSTGEMPYILWMENVDLSHDDSPGLFGSGLIDNIGVLKNKAIGQILQSLAGFYSDKAVDRNKGAAKSFQPKVAYQSFFSINPDDTYTVAVMPFYNKSKSLSAGDIVALRFVNQLVKNKTFQVIDPGVVRQNLLNFRVIMPDGASKVDADSFFYNLGTDLIFMGRILSYHEKHPKIEFDVQVYERKSRAMVSSSWSHNQGNDDVVLFDWKQVNNAGALASQMINNIIQDLTRQ